MCVAKCRVNGGECTLESRVTEIIGFCIFLYTLEEDINYWPADLLTDEDS
jgi:hypothetical protein